MCYLGYIFRVSPGEKDRLPRLQYKNFASPSEVRNFPNGFAEVVSLDESVVGRTVFEPVWRWSADIAPIVGTSSCQLHHLGYAISGAMRVVMDMGRSSTFRQGPYSRFRPVTTLGRWRRPSLVG
jgi:hypothetical protein